MWGVQDSPPTGSTLRVTLKTAPLEQWAVAREMRERIKARFDHEGIEIPFPQRVVWHRDGAAETPTGDDAPDQAAEGVSDQLNPAGVRFETSGECGVQRDRGAGERLADRAARLGGLGGGDEVVVAHALDDAAHGQLDAGDAGAGRELDVGAGVQRGRRRAGLGQAVGEAPSRSRPSGRPRSAPRGWSCRWPPRRGRARTRRRCRDRTSRGSPCRRPRRGCLPSGWSRCGWLPSADRSLWFRDSSFRVWHAGVSAARGRSAQWDAVSTFYDEIGGFETIQPDRRHVLRGRGRATRCCARSTPRRTSVRPRSASCSSSCSTGAARRRTPTRAATRGCGCGTRRSR